MHEKYKQAVHRKGKPPKYKVNMKKISTIFQSKETIFKK